MTKRISKEKAKALIEEADAGLIAVVSIRPIPHIGTVEEPMVEVEETYYRFHDERIRKG